MSDLQKQDVDQEPHALSQSGVVDTIVNKAQPSPTFGIPSGGLTHFPMRCPDPF